MGTSDLSIPGVFSSILLLQAVAARIHPGLCYLAIVRLYENHKASETSQEEEAKDASSSLYVKTETTEQLQTFYLLTQPNPTLSWHEHFVHIN